MRCGVRLKRHVERLGEVPCQRELAIPQEILAHSHWQIHIHVGLVAGLLFIIRAVDAGDETKLLWEPVEFPFAQELQVLALALWIQALKWLEWFKRWSIIILETATIVVGVFILVIGVFVVTLIRRVIEDKVGWVPRHRKLALNVESQA